MITSCGDSIASRCLITGANGFIGSALYEFLQRRDMAVRGAVRQLPNRSGDWVEIKGLDRDTDWRPALLGCDVVVHTAGRAHVLGRQSVDALDQFREVNLHGTLALARQAVEMGVRRFVFISSIGVNGSSTVGTPFTEQDLPAPQAPYAQSKYEAELALQDLVSGQDMDLVIVRPPLVYAAHAPGNFAKLLGLVKRGIPLPLAYINNHRSIIALENLLDFLSCCVIHPAAANQLFLVADGEDVSTKEIIGYISDGMGKKAQIFPAPPMLMSFAAKCIGAASRYEQLCGSLQVDIGKAQILLDWQAPLRTVDALRLSGSRYLDFEK